MSLISSLNNRWLADSGLILSALTWGFNTVLIKITVQSVPPFSYLGLRFLIATALMSLLTVKYLKRLKPRHWAWSVLVGFLLCGALALQTIGLQYTTPGLSAFLTITYILFVPLIKSLATRQFPETPLVIGILAVTVGMWLLFYGGNFSLGIGEVLTLLGAILFACHILALDRAVSFIDPLSLATIQMGLTGLVSMLLALAIEDFQFTNGMFSWLAILYGAIFGSVVAFLIQTWAQRLTPPAQVGMLLSLEAVFALLFSLTLGMDTLTPNLLIGLLLVLAGTVIAELPHFKQKREKL